MRWPPALPTVMRLGDVSVRPYSSEDAAGLFDALDDERVWEHIPREIPINATELDDSIRLRLADGNRRTFTVRRTGRVVGVTSVIYDPSDPAGVEIGGTQLTPAVWGSGVNDAAKSLLIDALFGQRVAWIQFRTDERNARSAAALLKLGAADLGARPDTLMRRDGTVRRSRFFRLTRPAHSPTTGTSAQDTPGDRGPSQEES